MKKKTVAFQDWNHGWMLTNVWETKVFLEKKKKKNSAYIKLLLSVEWPVNILNVQTKMAC